MEYLKTFLDQFFSMGIYAYFFIGFIIFAIVFSIASFMYNKNSKEKWLANHPGAVTISLVTGNNFITEKQFRARVISGDATMFFEKGKYAIFSMPGDIVVEVTYIYSRPGVLHKKVTTTYGPTKIELHIEQGKNYSLTFNKKEERFILEEK